MAARTQPKNGRAWTPEKVRERIRIGSIVSRLEKQALGLLEGEQIVKRPLIIDGQLQRDENGKPRTEVYLRSIGMTGPQLTAAIKLLDRCLARAQAPLDVALSGSIIVEEIDPTIRGENYQRRRTGKAAIARRAE
jgi:hypothetical protein